MGTLTTALGSSLIFVRILDKLSFTDAKNPFSSSVFEPEELEPEGFLRIQKSYLVNMAHIKKLNFDHVLLSNGEELPVSQKRYAQLKIQYLGWKNKQWGKSL